MTFRSKLFATVALPVLSTVLIATPTLADALMKPFEVAQENTGEGQPSEEDLLLQQQQQQQDDAQRAAEEEQQRQADEQKAAEDAENAAAEQKAAEEEAQRAAGEEQQRQADEQKAAEDAENAAAEQKAAEEEAQRAAGEEQQRQADEQKAAEDAEKAAAEQKAAEEEAQRAAGEEQQRQADEQKAAEDAEKAAAEQKAAEEEAQRAAGEEQQRQAEEQKAAEDAEKAAAEQKAAEEEAQRAAGEEQQRQADEQNAAGEQKPAEEQQAEQPVQQQDGITEETTTGEQPAAEEREKPAVAVEETPAETGTDQPATAETGETPVEEPVVETLTEEQKQEIAEDPSKTDETVVLPVENGAAVLDSDKDADKAGGRKGREDRRKQREELRAQDEAVPVPESDDSAQAEISEEVREAVPGKIEAAINEDGERVEKAPDFAMPETTNIINNTVINNTIVNNNTVNNTTVDNTTIDNSVTEVNVIERIENRTVLEVGDQLIVRGDDRPRLRRDSEEVFYDNLARGRVRETITRPGGVRIVTIYNRYGDIIQRSRVGRDGREYILVYAPELEGDAPRPGLVDVGYELPPMRLRIPVSDYIIDTSSEPDRDFYEFLSEPPVERVERVYSIDEVKHSARLRDKVRRIDLDTITFATGSAEVPMSQARTLRSVAEAMQKVLDKDPGETFLIEGHTDAVGADKPNLVLSDERAESVASLLTEVYGVPPENLQTQGYGERFLKVRTDVAEQQNRRVTIRRVTTLVRPMAKAN
ncbi:OmpA family protein [Sinorhizobium sp. RAC02]|uniref:OmpA family protein n=1 Tax=Sinorhizobium sp. RAC02 TaxID=1842534 RepID=UPI00083E3EB8|nr:OmpA family protein [Sinorhizobium sp. RAC02]AOF89479.1 ompA family protein [Sinorhizobium sp. RAC02]